MKKLFKINFPLLFAALLFVACDSDDSSDPVVPVNVPPVAVDLSMAMDMAEGNSKTITLAATDADGDVLTYSIVSQSSLGNVTVDGNKATFTANENANGDTTFTYKANDGNADSNTATVAVSITGDFVLKGDITSKKTLTADNVWTLDGAVFVLDGGELVIPAGTIIKAKAGQDTDASYLAIARGGKIDAQGTADKPIIMTTVADDIEPGEKFGSSLTVDNRGLWGGLIVLGKAPSSFKGDVSEFAIEGVPGDDDRGLYGGSDAADNSGIMKYISIRHGGALIGADNEINGLTLGGVGTGTVIDNIEVVANVDDGIEFFGGTVNATNLLVWGQGDDGLDIDQAYAGTVDNAAVIAEAASDHGMEIDGPEGSAPGKFMLKNITLIGSSTAEDGEYNDNRKGATGTINGLLAYGFQVGKDFELDKEADEDTFLAGDLVFQNFEVVVPDGDSLTGGQIFDAKADHDDTLKTTYEEAKNISGETFAKALNDATSATVGADMSKFGWTMAKVKGKF